MARVVRARYGEGVLKPLGALDLDEGTLVVVEVKSFRGFTKRGKGGIAVVDEDPVENLAKERR